MKLTAKLVKEIRAALDKVESKKGEGHPTITEFVEAFKQVAKKEYGSHLFPYIKKEINKL